MKLFALNCIVETSLTKHKSCCAAYMLEYAINMKKVDKNNTETNNCYVSCRRFTIINDTRMLFLQGDYLISVDLFNTFSMNQIN